MANLISRTAQHTLFARMLMRTALVGTGILVFVALIGIASLLPGYILLEAEQESLQYELSILEAAGAAGSSDRDAIASTNKRMRIVSTLLERTTRVPEAIEAAALGRVPGMKIRRIAYDSAFGAGTTTQPSLAISGVFRDREDSTAYLEKLRAMDIFATADIPLSSFTLRELNAVNFLMRGAF